MKYASMAVLLSVVACGPWAAEAAPVPAVFQLVRVTGTATCSINRPLPEGPGLIQPAARLDSVVNDSAHDTLANACRALARQPAVSCPLFDERTADACLADAEVDLGVRWSAMRPSEAPYARLDAPQNWQFQWLTLPALWRDWWGQTSSAAAARSRQGSAPLVYVAQDPSASVKPTFKGWDELPFVLRVKSPGKDACGGVQIDAMSFLTAAHCLPANAAVVPGILPLRCNGIETALELVCRTRPDLDLAQCTASEPLSCGGALTHMALADEIPSGSPAVSTVLVSGWDAVAVPRAYCVGPPGVVATKVRRGICPESWPVGVLDSADNAGQPYVTVDFGDSGMPVFERCGNPLAVVGLVSGFNDGGAPIFLELTCPRVHAWIVTKP